MDGTSRDVTIVNSLGLHARSAAQIAKAAHKTVSPVWVCKGDICADASDILDLMSLLCPPGTRLTIRVEDAADAAVLRAIAELVESGFGELAEDEQHGNR